MIDEAHSIARHFNSYFNKKPPSHTKIPVLVLFIYCGMACSFMHPVSVKNPAAEHPPPQKKPLICAHVSFGHNRPNKETGLRSRTEMQNWAIRSPFPHTDTYITCNTHSHTHAHTQTQKGKGRPKKWVAQNATLKIRGGRGGKLPKMNYAEKKGTYGKFFHR